MKDLAAFSAREVKRVAAEERKRDEYSLQKDSESQRRWQSHPSELLKIEGWGTHVGAKDRRERDR